MLIVLKRIEKTNAVLFVLRVSLVQSRYNVAFLYTRLAHNFELSAHNFNSYLFSLALGLEIDGFYNAGKDTFSSDAYHSVLALDNLSCFGLIVTFIVDRWAEHSKTFFY